MTGALQKPDASTICKATPAPSPSALFSTTAHLRLWLAAALIVAADLISKQIAFDRLSYSQPCWIIRDLLYFQLSLNRGAVFGLMPGWSIIFILASLLAAAFVIYLFAHADRRHWGLQIALGLILGGTFGNLYDRLFCIVDVAAPGTSYELRGLQVAHDEQSDLYTIAGYPDGREMLGQAPGPIVRQPVVRDFIKIDAHLGNYPLWRWIFNLADAALMIGVILLLLLSWRHHRRRPAAARSASA